MRENQGHWRNRGIINSRKPLSPLGLEGQWEEVVKQSPELEAIQWLHSHEGKNEPRMPQEAKRRSVLGSLHSGSLIIILLLPLIGQINLEAKGQGSLGKKRSFLCYRADQGKAEKGSESHQAVDSTFYLVLWNRKWILGELQGYTQGHTSASGRARISLITNQFHTFFL